MFSVRRTFPWLSSAALLSLILCSCDVNRHVERILGGIVKNAVEEAERSVAAEASSHPPSAVASVRLSPEESARIIAQTPSCPANKTDLGDGMKVHVTGTLEGKAINDLDSEHGLNAELINGRTGHFKRTVADPSDSPTELPIDIFWNVPLSGGVPQAISQGTFVAPGEHPRAGQIFCIVAGTVSQVPDGPEAGALKFAITRAAQGANCSGPTIPVDLRGCFN